MYVKFLAKLTNRFTIHRTYKIIRKRLTKT